MNSSVAVVDDNLVRAGLIRLANGRKLGGGGRIVVRQRPVLAFALHMPAAAAVRNDVEGRGGGRHGTMIAFELRAPIRLSPQVTAEEPCVQERCELGE